MKFRDAFKNIELETKQPSEIKIIQESELDDNIEKIKKSKIKIRQIIPTRFGKEVVFFRDSDAEEAAKVVGTKKIDGKSIFIEN